MVYHVTIFVTKTEPKHQLRRRFILLISLWTGIILVYIMGPDVCLVMYEISDVLVDPVSSSVFSDPMIVLVRCCHGKYQNNLLHRSWCIYLCNAKCTVPAVYVLKVKTETAEGSTPRNVSF